jgi:SGNH hydrolase-like domain, acetyltransferase AlgX
MQQWIKNGLVVLMFGLLFLPLLQLSLVFVDEPPLEGVGYIHLKPTLTTETWANGKYQDSLSDYLTQNGGFGKSLIRLHNQYYFTLFNTALANHVIIGQNNFLFDQKHINAYTGADYIGKEGILKGMLELRDLRSILLRKRIKLVVVVLPGKATGAPENLPNGTPAPGITNYSAAKHIADSLQIPILDLITWYNSAKPHAQYPLYPSGGIHWSQYCAALAADTLLGYVAGMTQTMLPRYAIDHVEVKPGPEGEDSDIQRGMNLLFPIGTTPMGYPSVKWNEATPNLKVLTIGDSYYWNPFVNYTSHAFAASHFWFYYRDLSIFGSPQGFPTAQVDLGNELESQNVLMLYTSDAHLVDFSGTFIPDALRYFRGPLSAEAIARVCEDIKNDTNWYQQILAKSAQEGVTSDSMLRRDAIWVLEKERSIE